MAIDRTAFNALVDSNGSPGHGSIWDKAAIAAVLLDPIDAIVRLISVTSYGAIGDGDTSKAAANSAAIQDACDVAYGAGEAAGGGGTVYFPPGTYCIDTPIIVRAGVSLLGADRYAVTIKKTTATASAINDTTAPVYQYPTAVGYPICVLHFVGPGSSAGWSYGTVSNLTVEGDTNNPNTSAVHYGFFFRGISNGTVTSCQAKNVRVGYFFGDASSIFATIHNNTAYQVWRGFYQYLGTGGSYHSNFVITYRYCGHDLAYYYSDISANGCDGGGSATVRVADTEVCYGYVLYDCKGVSFHSNGCELHNGPSLLVYGGRQVSVRNNAFIQISSDHDNVASGLDIYALDMNTTTDLVVEDNLFVFPSPSLSGDAVSGDHFNWRVTGQVGFLIFRRNRFVNTISGTTDAGWTNISGAIAHVAGVDDLYVETTITPAATFSTPGDVAVVYGGSNTGRYTRIGNLVQWSMDLDCTSITWTTASGFLKITGLPQGSASVDSGGAMVYHTSALTYSAGVTQVVPTVGTVYVYISQHKSATGTTNIGVANLVSGAALRLQMSGVYALSN